MTATAQFSHPHPMWRIVRPEFPRWTRKYAAYDGRRLASHPHLMWRIARPCNFHAEPENTLPMTAAAWPLIHILCGGSPEPGISTLNPKICCL